MRFASGCQIENQGAHLFRVGNADAGSFHDSIAIEYQRRDSRRRIEVFSTVDIAAHFKCTMAALAIAQVDRQAKAPRFNPKISILQTLPPGRTARHFDRTDSIPSRVRSKIGVRFG